MNIYDKEIFAVSKAMLVSERLMLNCVLSKICVFAKHYLASSVDRLLVYEV